MRGNVARATTSVLPEDCLIGSGEVARRLNCHVITIYRFLRERDDFPVPIRISANRLAWRESSIRDFIASRPLRERKAEASRGKK